MASVWPCSTLVYAGGAPCTVGYRNVTSYRIYCYPTVQLRPGDSIRVNRNDGATAVASFGTAAAAAAAAVDEALVALGEDVAEPAQPAVVWALGDEFNAGSCADICARKSGGLQCVQEELDGLLNSSYVVDAFSTTGINCSYVLVNGTNDTFALRDCGTEAECAGEGAPYIHTAGMGARACVGGVVAPCQQEPADMHHRRLCPVRQRSSLLKAVITAFPSVSLPFLAVPLCSHRTLVAISAPTWSQRSTWRPS
eukprot:SAG22_NODE_375_length_11547_cov_12.885657_10_plen_253_part_00